MGTKNNPGKFDCYENAEPDEPVFILLGRDPLAAPLVRLWAMMREECGPPRERPENPDVVAAWEKEKVAEAQQCADTMEKYAREKRGDSKVDNAQRVYERLAGV